MMIKVSMGLAHSIEGDRTYISGGLGHFTTMSMVMIESGYSTWACQWHYCVVMLPKTRLSAVVPFSAGLVKPSTPALRDG